MGRIRLLIVSAAVPGRVAAIRITGFQCTFARLAEERALRCAGERLSDLASFRLVSGKGGRSVECLHSLPRRDLIPPAPIGGVYHSMGCIRLIVLGGAEQLHIGLLAIWAGCRSADVAAGDLSVRILHVGSRAICQLRHIAGQAAVCDLTRDGARDLCRAACNRGYGIRCQRGPIPGSHAAEGAANEADATARTHTGAAIYYRIADEAVGLIAADKARQDAAASPRGGPCRRSTGCGPACTAKCGCGAASAPSPGEAGDDSGCHEHFHTHAAAGLGHGEPQRGQVAVTFLCDLQQRQCAEQPQEDAALPGGECAAVGDKLTHRRVESPEEPDVEHQQKQLGAYHPAPGLEYPGCSLRGPHGVGQGRGVTEHPNQYIALYGLQQ